MANLISVQEFQSVKGVGRTASEARIQALIEKVSALVRKYCNRNFHPIESTQEIYVLWEEPYLLLQEIPLIKVLSINGEDFDESDYIVTRHSGQIRIKEGVWEPGTNYNVKYWGGYISDPADVHDVSGEVFTTVESLLEQLETYQQNHQYNEANDPETPRPILYPDSDILATPEDVKLATIDLVNYYLKEEYKESKTAQAFSIETPGTTTIRGDDSFPDHIKRVLDMYKLRDLNG